MRLIFRKTPALQRCAEGAGVAASLLPACAFPTLSTRRGPHQECISTTTYEQRASTGRKVKSPGSSPVTTIRATLQSQDSGTMAMGTQTDHESLHDLSEDKPECRFLLNQAQENVGQLNTLRNTTHNLPPKPLGPIAAARDPHMSEENKHLQKNGMYTTHQPRLRTLHVHAKQTQQQKNTRALPLVTSYSR